MKTDDNKTTEEKAVEPKKRRGRRKMPKTLLKEAVEADDNLAVLKAQRLMVIDYLTQPSNDLETRDVVQLQTSLTNLNKEIIKLEGANEEAEEKVEKVRETDDAIRRALFGGGLKTDDNTSGTA